MSVREALDEAQEKAMLTMRSAIEYRDPKLLIDVCDVLFKAIHEALAQLEEMERDHEAARKALEPFAKFACGPPCGCHNCTARAILGASGEDV